MITVKQTQAIYKLYSKVTNTNGDIAYDANGNVVDYDLSAVIAKAEEDEQATAAHKESAIAKLVAIGLSADEIKALLK